MKISEVIKELQELLDKQGDLQVRVEADHGQTAMKANCVVEGYIDEDVYMPEGVHPDDLDGYEGAIKVVIIERY
jgi:hypothetical protein